MTTLSILHVFNLEELNASGLAAKWYENFDMGHLLKADLIRMEKYSPVYYVVAADAEHNYGLDFNIYTLYTIPEGLTFFAQFSYQSCIHSGGLRQVWIQDESHLGINAETMKQVGIEPNIIRFGTVYYDKGRQHRAKLAEACQKMGWILN
jgi:hypothetical protein